MLNLPIDSGSPPLFSIIIPLEFHRGQWERAWLGWKEQTVDSSLYEIVLVVPPDFSPQEELSALARLGARLEDADCCHDVGLCAIGATMARGEYLFFTESHCRPEPNVLELCIRAFAEHPDWVGFSCRSVPICHNRLSEAEAAMYQADIEFGMKVHPWLKVLDQCFVTRRDAYEQCGGLRAELGHFAEWVLAADYHARGSRLGYLETAHFHHYYIGKLGALLTFTRDFVEGEIRYFSEDRRNPGAAYLEPPVEWSCRDNFDSSLARDILLVLLRSGAGHKSCLAQWRAIRRWLAVAASGDRLARSAALIAAIHARCLLAGVLLAGSRESVSHKFRRYIAALIRLQRLETIAAARQEREAADSKPSKDCVLTQTGFYPRESWSDRVFRWSETEAAVRIERLSGCSTVRIQCLPVRDLEGANVRFYLDGRRLAGSTIVLRGDAFILSVGAPASGRAASLVWTCSAFEAINDPRRLGLPVAAIAISPGGGACPNAPPEASAAD